MIRDVWNFGYPFIIVKVVNRPRVVEDTVRELWGRRLKLSELNRVLRKVNTGEYVWVSTCFSPDRFTDPHLWSYTWHLDTVISEVGDVDVTVLPPTRDGVERYWAYKGLAILAISPRIEVEATTGLPIPEKIKIVGFAVTNEPRRVAVIEVERRGDGYVVTVVTAWPGAATALSELGFKPVTEYKFAARVSNEYEARELAEKARDALAKLGLHVLHTRHLEQLLQRLKGVCLT